jgi:hypothetical protein
MKDNRYAAAGWASILSAACTLAMLGLSFVFDLAHITQGKRGFPPPPWPTDQAVLVAAVDAIAWALGIYALLRFRRLLHERYDFHAVDHLIWIVIGAGLLVAVVSHGFNLSASRELGRALTSMATLGILGVLNGIIGIVFATRLLRVNGNLNGYKKPLVYTYVAGSVCFLLVIPSVVGVALLAAWNILLGLVFFRGEELEELEVV